MGEITDRPEQGSQIHARRQWKNELGATFVSLVRQHAAAGELLSEIGMENRTPLKALVQFLAVEMGNLQGGNLGGLLEAYAMDHDTTDEARVAHPSIPLEQTTLASATRPWGQWFDLLHFPRNARVKLLRFDPEGKTSVHKHAHKTENVFGVLGSLAVTLWDSQLGLAKDNPDLASISKKTTTLSRGEACLIEQKRWHMLSNLDNMLAWAIEIQLAAPVQECREDDITRWDADSGQEMPESE